MYIGQLIDDLIRPKTGNTTVVSDSTTGDTLEGISTTLILSYLNDALTFLQSRIISVYPNEFVKENIQSTVVDQEAYSISDNVFLNNKWITVDFSRDGDLENYQPLPPAGLHQRDTKSGSVYQYIRKNGKCLLNRIPNDTRGKLRINYYRAIDKFDIRRGQITSANSTTMVLDDDSYLDSPSLSDAQYICTVDKYGVVQDYNIPITSYTSGTRTIVYPSQTVNAAAGEFVVIGKYKSTHLIVDFADNSNTTDDLIQQMLKYCKLVAQARIFDQDSSTDVISEKQEVQNCLADIIDSFSELTEDVMHVPNIDDDTYYG